MPAHTVTLVVIDAPDGFSHHRLHQLVAASLPQMARFRSRLVAKPLGLGQPLWAEIEDYDPSPQIHNATVRAPGGRRELADLIADLSTARQEPRDRLWEAWIIDGLAGGRWALAVKTSPVLNDGAAGLASLWPRLLTALPHADAINNLPAEPSIGSAPSAGEVFTDVMSEIAENHVTGMWLAAQTMSGALRALRDRLSDTAARDLMAPTASPMSGPLPHTAFNVPPTNRRAVAFASIRLADVKTVSDAFGGSIPNVVLAACTLSLRSWLQQHDNVPDDPLLMLMPFELPATDPTNIGKALTVGRLRIPVHLDDPVQVLANLHTATERLNAIRSGSNQKGSPTVDVATLTSLMPPSVVRFGTQLYTRSGLRHRFEPICHGSVSYVANGAVPAYCAGAKVIGMHNVAPLAEGSGLNIALTSHGEELDVSVCACPDTVPGVDDIATGVAHFLDILLSAAKESPRGQGRSVVSEMTSHSANRPRGRSFHTFR